MELHILRGKSKNIKRIDRFIYAIEKGERSGRLNTAADSQEYKAPDYDEWRRRY